MTWGEAGDLAGAILLLVGAFLCLSAAVGLVRFPDTITRMHAATKPQTLGLVLIVIGVAVSLRDVRALGVLLLVAILQLMTSPVSAHMVARTAYRSHQISNGAIIRDELAEDLAKAGFELKAAPEQSAPLVDVPDDPTPDDPTPDDPTSDTPASDTPASDTPVSDPPDNEPVGPQIQVPDHDPGEEPGPPR